MLPTVAFAADTGKAIQLVNSGSAANISGSQEDSIYFGTYRQSSDGSGSYNTEPVKWRVLSNADGKMFLLADQNLDVKPYNSSYISITWEKSTIRSWLNGYGANENSDGTDYSSDNFIGTAFSGEEQSAICDTYVYNATQSDESSNPNPSYNTAGGNNTTDKIFLLSIEEAINSSYFPNGNESRKSTNTAYVASYSGMVSVGNADYWWLRSPGSDDLLAVFVPASGGVDSSGFPVAHPGHAVRPAFNLNLDAVLFTSAAVGGKSSGAVGADALIFVSNYSGSEWKLTLQDSSRRFSADVNGQTSASVPAACRSPIPAHRQAKTNMSPSCFATAMTMYFTMEILLRIAQAVQQHSTFHRGLRRKIIPSRCSANSATAINRPTMRVSFKTLT